MSQEGPAPEAGNGIDIGFGRAHISARGHLTVFVLSIIAVIGSILYAGYRQEQTLGAIWGALTHARDQQRDEHTAIARNQDIIACFLLIPQDERKLLSEHYSPELLMLKCPFVAAPTPAAHP